VSNFVYVILPIFKKAEKDALDNFAP